MEKINKEVLRDITYGLYVVSSVNEDGHYNGQIVNTIFQLTSEPVRICVSISKENLTHEYISHSNYFTVSILEEETPMALIGTFGFKSGKEINKFEGINYKIGGNKCPILLENTLSVMEVNVFNKVDLGSHTVFLGDLVSSEVLKKGKPLTYAYYHEVKRGKTPKNAVTYIAGDKPEKDDIIKERRDEKVGRYVCDVCGYIYDPDKGDPDNDIEPGTSFADLPADWVCPVCGVSKADFSAME